jgi:hypothetical protein
MTEALVLVQPEHAGSAPALWRGWTQVTCGSDADVSDAIEQTPADLVVIHGDDGLVSRVLSNWYRDRSRRSASVVFAAAPVGDSAVAHALGAVRLGKWGKALRKAAERNTVSSKPLAALSVSDCGLPFRRVAFSVGFGRFATAGFGSVAELAEQALEGDRTEPFRWVVDGQPQEEAGYLVISSLPAVFGGLAMGDGPTFRAGRSLAGLLPQTTRLGRVVSRATGAGAAREFDRIHIDGATGYLLDGIALTVDRPGVVEVRPGPRPAFARV